MDKKDIFRTAVFGGYQKDDVMDYIRSLENENETIRILTKKENSSIKAELEKEKAAGEELREAVSNLKQENRRLEERASASDAEEAGENENSAAVGFTGHEMGKQLLEEIRLQGDLDKEWKQQLLNRDERFLELLSEMKKSNELLSESFKELRESMVELSEMDWKSIERVMSGSEAASLEPPEGDEKAEDKAAEDMEAEAIDQAGETASDEVNKALPEADSIDELEPGSINISEGLKEMTEAFYNDRAELWAERSVKKKGIKASATGFLGLWDDDRKVSELSDSESTRIFEEGVINDVSGIGHAEEKAAVTGSEGKAPSEGAEDDEVQKEFDALLDMSESLGMKRKDKEASVDAHSIETEPDRGYHEKAYDSLRDIRNRASKLLSTLDDSGFAF